MAPQKPSGQNPVCDRRQRHRHRLACQQLVAGIGAVFPAQELCQGHPFDRSFAHPKPPDVNLAPGAANVTRHYSMTSSARSSMLGGTVRPSAFAVFRLMINEYFVGC